MCPTHKLNAAILGGRTPQYLNNNANSAYQGPAKNKPSLCISQGINKKENSCASLKSRANSRHTRSGSQTQKCAASRAARPPRWRRHMERVDEVPTLAEQGESWDPVRKQRKSTGVAPISQSPSTRIERGNISGYDFHTNERAIYTRGWTAPVLGKRKRQDNPPPISVVKRARKSSAILGLKSCPKSAAQQHLDEARSQLLDAMKGTYNYLNEYKHRAIHHRLSRMAPVPQVSSLDKVCLPLDLKGATTILASQLWTATTKHTRPLAVPKPLPLYRGRLDKILDEIARRAVRRAMRLETPPTSRSSPHNRPQDSGGPEPATRNRALFQQRFSGRPVVAGGASVGFVPTSIIYAYRPQLSSLQLSSLASQRYRKPRLAHSRPLARR
ncbi:hypothetical protein BDY19DRAFT_988491 [Irpex rosettiformis]|uniref:Uncharacterized protein n=1 Tax=Irpex rosettiformis TaxID=378272 RepID=A0ACB8UJV7_9APHY|nr:hypothetical protein BDY19DRAFT_988491 [Irpex rosettiformis]